ncbi:putative UDP-glucuronosyl/UDP-glucosyltransferase, UDP-glycosyltransferase family [Helianthus annuus]|nr:putative UDP-glucuronosyl/UDP-glucosyltransferase, UDP-glycosyltransferase family [Helianthus annuus]KAJ0554453.1 putative UDP-glucuronosyl/UDP-glucosyltransferase, UDP-glycosyltransferase family [Helianthus annuus]KAJ0898993.1 putative UDP-glucuronosyl/UDP-glucosyltransferase, UDP-glycosyltransferase family [Helianthus annuus]
MDAMATAMKKPHAIFIPYPDQSHIKAMLKLAELLHHKGLLVTFVITEFVHKRFLESAGPHCLDGSPGFCFETIPIATSGDELIQSVETDFLAPFVDLLTKLLHPPTCIISDGLMSVFTIDAAQKVGVPVMLYWTVAACSFMGFYQTQYLIEKGLAPLKDESYLTNGYLDTVIDWVPGMEGIRLKDFPIAWTTDPMDEVLKFSTQLNQRSHRVSHHIFHTFDALEGSVIKALSSMYDHVYTIGPLQLLLDQIPETGSYSFPGYSLLKEEPECFKWLESKEPNSVIYVNFGSATVMSLKDLQEFGWGLANSNHYFVWIIRSGLVIEETAVLGPEFEEHIKKRGFIASWCSQEKVLNHPSVGGFLSHCGWGSTIESLSAGVPMICWPHRLDQVTNCRYICEEWGVGVEMQGSKVRRDEVTRLVQELMGEGGRGIRNKAVEWKEKACVAAGPYGSSSLNVDEIVKEITMMVSRG